VNVKEYGLIGIGGLVELSKGGVKLKNDSGALSARNNIDGDYVVVRGADPINDNDLVTKKYLKTRANVQITDQINGGAPPVVVNGAVYIVTTTGGGYTLKQLYYGTGGVWESITLVEGLEVVVTDALTGGTDEYLADHIYVWDADGTTWVMVGPAIADTKLVKNERVTVTTASAGTVNVGSAIPISAEAATIKINVTQAFNGTAPTLKIGDAGDDDRFMTTDEIDLKTVGIYYSPCAYLFGGSTQVTGTFVNDSSTLGSCLVMFEWNMA